jgi:hypothetical protein
MSAWGQTLKTSMRAYVFWFPSESGHRQLTNELPYPSFAKTLLARRWVDFAAWLYRPNVGGKSGAVTCRTFSLCPNFVRFRGGLLHSNHFFSLKWKPYHTGSKIEVADFCFGSWLCENGKTLNDDRRSYSSKTVLGLQLAFAFNLRIELKNVILVVLRFFAFSHSQGQKLP